jgi:hypothetical protein
MVCQHSELDAVAGLAEDPALMVAPITLLLAAQPAEPTNGGWQPLSPLFLGFAGGLIGSAASLGGVLVANRFQLRRDRDNDLRKLRDDRFQRLRSDYVVLLAAAHAMMDIPRPRMTGAEDRAVVQETLQQARRQLAKATEDLAVARVRVVLEEGGPEARAALDQVEEKAQELIRWLNKRSQGEAVEVGDNWSEVLIELLDGWVDREVELSSAVRELERMARTHLQRLEQPIGGRK